MKTYDRIYRRLAALWEPRWATSERQERLTARDAVWCRLAEEAPLLTRAYR